MLVEPSEKIIECHFFLILGPLTPKSLIFQYLLQNPPHSLTTSIVPRCWRAALLLLRPSPVAAAKPPTGRRQCLYHAIAAAIIATVTTVATDESSADGVFPSPPATYKSAARSRHCSRMQRPLMLPVIVATATAPSDAAPKCESFFMASLKKC